MNFQRFLTIRNMLYRMGWNVFKVMNSWSHRRMFRVIKNKLNFFCGETSMDPSGQIFFEKYRWVPLRAPQFCIRNQQMHFFHVQTSENRRKKNTFWEIFGFGLMPILFQYSMHEKNWNWFHYVVYIVQY